MTSEVEERPRLVTAGYGRHRSQWVKLKHILGSIKPNHRKDKCEHLIKFCLCFNYSQAHKHWKALTLISTMMHRAPKEICGSMTFQSSCSESENLGKIFTSCDESWWDSGTIVQRFWLLGQFKCTPQQESWRVSWQDPGNIFVANIFASRWESWQDSHQIAPRVWPLGFLLSSKTLDKIRDRIAPRFWPLGFCFPTRFWHWDFPFRWESCHDLPAEKTNPSSQNLARFPLRLGQDPAKIQVLILQGWLLT